jgi:hypothetical protein
VFFVFPPFPFYVRALLDPLAQPLHLNAFNIAAFLSLFASGAFAYVWLRRRFQQSHALIAASLYMILPYHLALDFYRRFALPECWALAWAPLMMYFSEAYIDNESRALAGISLSYALLMLSHAISAAMFFPVVLGMVIFGSPREKKSRAAILVAGALFLGIGISGFYLLPAVVHERFIRPATLLNINHYLSTNNLVMIGRRILPESSHYTFLSTVTWVVLDMVALTAVCAWVLYRAAPGDSELKRLTGFWVGVAAFAVFMMSELSYPLWRLIPQLSDAVQFPWRFNIILCVATAPLLAALVGVIATAPTPLHSGGRVFLLLNVILWMGMWTWECSRYGIEAQPPADSFYLVNDHDGWFVAWAPPNLDQEAALEAAGQARARLVQGEGTVRIVSWQPRRIELIASSDTGGTLVINQFYYPSWDARTTAGAKLAIEPPDSNGLLRISLPPDTRGVVVSIPRSAAERVGLWGSIASVILCALLALSGWRPLGEVREAA